MNYPYLIFQNSFFFFNPISLELLPFAGLPFGNICWSPVSCLLLLNRVFSCWGRNSFPVLWRVGQSKRKRFTVSSLYLHRVKAGGWSFVIVLVVIVVEGFIKTKTVNKQIFHIFNFLYFIKLVTKFLITICNVCIAVTYISQS